MIEMEESKNEIRKLMLKRRESLAPQIVEKNSREIAKKIICMSELIKSSIIMCYIDFRNEVKTGDIIRTCLSVKKRIVVPLVIKGNERMLAASEIFDPESELERGTFGVWEPKKDCIRIIDPKSIDIVIIPGVAFDYSRNRLGFGAGYYDRFLQSVRKDCFKIGICHDLQLCTKIPCDSFDIPMDRVVTECRII